MDTLIAPSRRQAFRPIMPAALLGLLAILIGMILGVVQSSLEPMWIAFSIVALLAIWASSRCLWWYLVKARQTVVDNGEELAVYVGRRLLRSFRWEDIREVQLQRARSNPEWAWAPSFLIVEVRTSSRQTGWPRRSFAEVLLVGAADKLGRGRLREECEKRGIKYLSD